MPSSMGSSRPEDGTHVSCLLHWQVGSLPQAPSGKPLTMHYCYTNHIFPAPNQDTWQEVMYPEETTEYGMFEITMVTKNLGNLGDLTTASISILPDV